VSSSGIFDGLEHLEEMRVCSSESRSGKDVRRYAWEELDGHEKISQTDDADGYFSALHDRTEYRADDGAG
jgi:hypothetical protein